MKYIIGIALVVLLALPQFSHAQCEEVTFEVSRTIRTTEGKAILTVKVWDNGNPVSIENTQLGIISPDNGPYVYQERSFDPGFGVNPSISASKQGNQVEFTGLPYDISQHILVIAYKNCFSEGYNFVQ